MEEDFEERPIRQSDELTLALDGWEGPLDLLLNLARAQKVDLAQISILQLVEQYLDLSRRSARAEARDRRRLSRDGGVARLPQILPAAAQGPGGRPEPRGDRASPADAAPAARRDARGRRPAARPRPHRPRRVPARRARGASAGPQGDVAGARFRPVRGLRRGPRADPAGDARRPCPFGDDARGSDRAGRANDRHGARLDLPRKLPARDRRTRSCAARRWRRASSPRSSSPGAAGSISPRTSRSAPIKLKKAA